MLPLTQTKADAPQPLHAAPRVPFVEERLLAPTTSPSTMARLHPSVCPSAAAATSPRSDTKAAADIGGTVSWKDGLQFTSIPDVSSKAWPSCDATFIMALQSQYAHLQVDTRSKDRQISYYRGVVQQLQSQNTELEYRCNQFARELRRLKVNAAFPPFGGTGC